jgi:hypothetical protein
MSTLRSATSLSTLNCSLSEVTSRTMLSALQGLSVEDCGLSLEKGTWFKWESPAYVTELFRVSSVTTRILFATLSSRFVLPQKITEYNVVSLSDKGLCVFVAFLTADTSFSRWVVAIQNSQRLGSQPLLGIGQIRTATKKAGGTTKNNGSSPGQRLGIKKFSGLCLMWLLRCLFICQHKLWYQISRSYLGTSLSDKEGRNSTLDLMFVHLRSFVLPNKLRQFVSL